MNEQKQTKVFERAIDLSGMTVDELVSAVREAGVKLLTLADDMYLYAEEITSTYVVYDVHSGCSGKCTYVMADMEFDNNNKVVLSNPRFVKMTRQWVPTDDGPATERSVNQNEGYVTVTTRGAEKPIDWSNIFGNMFRKG